MCLSFQHNVERRFRASTSLALQHTSNRRLSSYDTTLHLTIARTGLDSLGYYGLVHCVVIRELFLVSQHTKNWPQQTN